MVLLYVLFETYLLIWKFIVIMIVNFYLCSLLYHWDTQLDVQISVLA